MSVWSDIAVADGATVVYRMSEASGALVDIVGAHNTTSQSGMTYAQAGPLVDDPNAAIAFAAGGASTPSNAAFNFGDTFSLEGWFKRSATQGVAQAITDRGHTTANGWLVYFASDNTFRLADSSGGTAIVRSAAITDTGWHHFLITKSGATSKLYIDGVDVSVAGTNATLGNATDAPTIGVGTGAFAPLTGSIGGLAFYPTALSAAQASTHYTARLGSSYGGSTGNVGLLSLDIGRSADLPPWLTPQNRPGQINGPTGFDQPYMVAIPVNSSVFVTAADSLTFADSLARIFSGARTATDTATTSDSASRILGLARSIADTLGLTGTVSRTASLGRAGSDLLTTSDQATRTGGFIRAIADTLATSDSAAGIKLIIRTAVDSLTSSDAATRSVSLVRAIADTITTSDAATRLGSFVRTATDLVQFVDSAVRTGTFLRSVADVVSAIGVGTRTNGAARAAIDTLTTSDAATRVKAATRSAADTITTSDAAGRLLTVVRTASDAWSNSDIATGLGGAIAALGGVPPRIASAVHSIVRGIGRRLGPPEH